MHMFAYDFHIYGKVWRKILFYTFIHNDMHYMTLHEKWDLMLLPESATPFLHQALFYHTLFFISYKRNAQTFMFTTLFINSLIKLTTH